ncbi:MAG: Lipopolysaccharide core heptosyltransferase RfaQ [Chlamydiae bacterium]|nr:Lipopolysaccharide core heptosyltransferase RfaQ [Chlamydiota bacterium]
MKSWKVSTEESGDLMKVLIVKTSSLGDITHTFPVAEYLHQKFPKAQIDWMVEAPFAELVEAHPFVNHVYRIETKKWRRGRDLGGFLRLRKALRREMYDAVFDLQGNFKSGLMTLQAKARQKVGFGRKTVPEVFNLIATNVKIDPPAGKNIREDYLYIVQKYFEDTSPFHDQGVRLNISLEQQTEIGMILSHPNLQQGRNVLVCQGSAWPNKQMNTPAFIDFLQRFQKETKCSYLFIWGNETEKKAVKEIHHNFQGRSVVVEKLPIPMLQNLMDQLDLVIAMDSLPLHLAGITSTPTFSIFGASSANKYRPIGAKHHSFQGTCPYKITFDKRCPKLRSCPTGACIRNLSGTDVFTKSSHGTFFLVERMRGSLYKFRVNKPESNERVNQ